jgi:hypothetical protein
VKFCHLLRESDDVYWILMIADVVYIKRTVIGEQNSVISSNVNVTVHHVTCDNGFDCQLSVYDWMLR